MNKGVVLMDVWSDYVCPFCYLAEPTVAQIEQEFGAVVQLTWRAFELRPEPVPTLPPNGSYLRRVWAEAVYPMAEQRGMCLRLPPVQPRSRLAHEAAVFARAHGRFAAMHHAIFRAFFEHGEDIGQVETLVKLGQGVGLEPEPLRQALREERYRSTVLSDQDTARELGLSGVPASLVRGPADTLERSTLVEGAQPFEVFRRAVRQVLDRVQASRSHLEPRAAGPG